MFVGYKVGGVTGTLIATDTFNPTATITHVGTAYNGTACAALVAASDSSTLLVGAAALLAAVSFF